MIHQAQFSLGFVLSGITPESPACIDHQLLVGKQRIKGRAMSSGSRIAALDGLRGVAILLVVLFHAYARWPDLMPFGSAYVDTPLRLGYVGVQLFFILSGFVIFMTLDKSPHFGAFMWRRWLRLMPAMLIASTLIAITAFALPERPAGPLVLTSLLPGLSFIEPGWWSRVLRTPVDGLEGAFWSLYVEMKFYVLAGAVYFLLGRRWVIPFLIVCFAIAAWPTAWTFGFVPVLVTKVVQGVARELSWVHFVWFASGCCFYEYFRWKKWGHFALGLMLAALGACVPWADVSHALAVWVVSLLFAACLVFEVAQRVLASKVIVFLGFISYPLYLMHENAMVGLSVKLAKHWPQILPSLVPLLALIPVVVVSWAVAKYGEPRIRAMLAHIRQADRH